MGAQHDCAGASGCRRGRRPGARFEGFIKGGGTGRFVLLPPYKQDGHPSFTGQPQNWKPAFEAFLKEVMGR